LQPDFAAGRWHELTLMEHFADLGSEVGHARRQIGGHA
jgi:hypothetical protein